MPPELDGKASAHCTRARGKCRRKRATFKPRTLRHHVIGRAAHGRRRHLQLDIGAMGYNTLRHQSPPSSEGQ
eukprot:scaffold91660_cov31-Tisochrysis_lutea.AAC.1